MPSAFSIQLLGFHLGPAPIMVGSLVTLLFLCFVGFYLVPFFQVCRRMETAAKALRGLQERGGVATKEEVGRIFQGQGSLDHAWSEYAETLHPQPERDERGEEVLAALRATLPAEVFFSTQSAVDMPLHAEFFRHLPGMLTGIGIIGTFSGLIMGLHDFHITSQPSELNPQLAGLIRAVTEAFVASGFAIAIAMIVTLVEKLCLNIAYRSLERLVASVETLYDAGVGEEYLRRLVHSSEESATQTRRLKDSLVEDLRLVFTELTERQIAATREMNEVLGTQIGQAIRQSLETPLDRIASEVERASREQSRQVETMLREVLTAFMAQLDHTLGDSMRNLSTMMAEAVRAMADMQAGFRKLLDDISRTGSETNRAMGEQLARMMAEAEQHQRLMIDALNRAMEDMQKRLLAGQTEVQGRMLAAVTEMKDALRAMLAELAAQREAQSRTSEADLKRLQQATEELLARLEHIGQEAADNYGGRIEATLGAFQTKIDRFLTASQDRQDRQDQRAKDLMGVLEDRLIAQDRRMGAMVDSAKVGAEAMRDSTRGLNEVTSRAVDGMGRGAESLRQATDGVSTAATRIAGVLDKAALLQNRLTDAAQSLESQGRVMTEVVDSYSRSRGSLESMAETLRRAAEDADQRGGLSRQMVDDMVRLVAHFAVVQQQIEGSLTQANALLKQGDTAFSAAISDTLGRVQDLAVTLESFRAKVG